MNLRSPPYGFCAIPAVYLLKIGQWLHSWGSEPAQLPAWLCPLPSLTALPSWPRVASCSGLIAHKTWHCTGWNALKVHTWKSFAFYIYKQLSSTKRFLSFFFFPPDSRSVGLIRLQKSKGKRAFSIFIARFHLKFQYFVLWAKEINSKYDISTHQQERGGGRLQCLQGLWEMACHTERVIQLCNSLYMIFILLRLHLKEEWWVFWLWILLYKDK